MTPTNDKEYMRAWRARNKDKVKANNARYAASDKGTATITARNERQASSSNQRARNKVQNRVFRKIWPHPSLFICSDCDQRAQAYHHEDYSLWWSVEPLCHKCHGIRHRQ